MIGFADYSERSDSGRTSPLLLMPVEQFTDYSECQHSHSSLLTYVLYGGALTYQYFQRDTVTDYSEWLPTRSVIAPTYCGFPCRLLIIVNVVTRNCLHYGESREDCFTDYSECFAEYSE